MMPMLCFTRENDTRHQPVTLMRASRTLCKAVLGEKTLFRAQCKVKCRHFCLKKTHAMHTPPRDAACPIDAPLAAGQEAHESQEPHRANVAHRDMQFELSVRRGVISGFRISGGVRWTL